MLPRPVEVQRVDQDAEALAAGGLDDPRRRGEVRHHGPGEELQHGAQPIRRGEVGHRREPVGEAREVRVVGRGDDVPRAELRPRREERFQRRHVGLRGDADELDVEHAHAGVGEGGPGRPHQDGIVHEPIARRGVGHRDQAQPDHVVAGAGGQPHHLGRGKAEHRQVGERDERVHGMPTRDGLIGRAPGCAPQGTAVPPLLPCSARLRHDAGHDVPLPARRPRFGSRRRRTAAPRATPGAAHGR